MAFDPTDYLNAQYFKWEATISFMYQDPFNETPAVYIHQDSGCQLCGLSNLTPQAIAQHQNDHGHRQRVEQMNKLIQSQSNSLRKRKAIQQYEGRIAKLGCNVWQNDIKADLFSYVLNDSASGSQVQNSIKKLGHYEHLERISILELRVWRFVCQINPVCPPNDPSFYMRWFEEGWKEQKTEMRHSNALAIIMSSVVPFLGKGPN